ncbi:MAG: hypothetical protein BGO68_05585 [Candidatus Amoebophilus sp. 36-38]|nr:MAG: hypothetical protein BGO68_05585 [Candidatus Amoebophilus sp. 36-38]
MSIIIEIKAIPNSKISTIYIDKTDHLCIRLISIPEHGKANQELINVIAKKLKVSRSSVELISGMKHKLKKLRIIGNFLDEKEVINKLIDFTQEKLFKTDQYLKK